MIETTITTKQVRRVVFASTLVLLAGFVAQAAAEEIMRHSGCGRELPPQGEVLDRVRTSEDER